MAPDAGSPPATGSEYLAYCRRRLHDEYAPRIRRCVNELTEEDIWWRAHETDNSIGNLLLHLSGNIRQWIIGGIGGAPDMRKRQAEFDERSHLPAAELLGRFEATVREACGVLEKFPPSLLLEVRIFQGDRLTCLDAVSHVVEHVAQHMGQIIYITKLRKGIDLRFFNL